jgi:MFS family permease
VRVLTPYLAILGTREARRLVLASLGARLSFGLFDLALVVLVQRETGSFAVAGVAVGVHAAGIGVTAPLRGRLLDRAGARRVLPPLVCIYALAVAALPLVSGAAAMVALAGVAGVAVPPLVAAMRLEWQRMLEMGSDALSTAYAFEVTAQIGVFLVGPLLAAAGIALAGPTVPLLAAAALVAGFGLRFARVAEPVPHRERPPARGLGAIRLGGVRTLVLATLLADAALGIVDVAVVAFATERGKAAAAGVLLAVFTTGAVAGGTAYGARAWRTAPMVRLIAVLAMFGVALAALALAGSLAVFAALLLLAGAPSAAQWATTSVALDDVTPPGQGAEAATWLSSANGAGIAVGGVAAGILVERQGTSAAFTTAAACAAAAALVVAQAVAATFGSSR